MLEFFCNIVCWTPWVSFFSECALIQLGVLMSFFYFNQARTLFYALIYMLLVFIWLGVFLSYYNIELFTGFLWVVELTVVFIIILFLFFFNFSSELRCSTFFFYKAAALLLFFFFFDEYTIHVSLLNFNFFFDDFYEARSSALMNDIHALFLSYYIFNSFLFFLLGLLIFFTSIICVCTLKAARNTCAEAVVNSLLIYNFFSDLLSFEFLRKQNLVFQNLRKPATRLIKKNFTGMVQKESRLSVADNCGVWSVGVFHIYRGFRHKIAGTGDFVRVSLKKTRPNNWLKRGKKTRAFIVRTAFRNFRKDGSYIQLLHNECLLLKKRMTPRGREISGPIVYGIRKKKVLASFIGVI